MNLFSLNSLWPNGNSSRLAHLADDGEHYFGLENFGNTCYCNSVLQALYFCKPFRNCVQNYQPLSSNDETLLVCLSELFKRISAQKKRCGVIAPKRFVTKLRKENELFRGYMHQDAQEFLNYLLNEVSETLIKERKMLEKTQTEEKDNKPVKTWVHDIFEGTLTNETRCLNCEMVTSREESFLDLSVDIEQNSSVSGCLKNFSSSEILCHKDKFFCDNCGSLQEAEKRMKIKKLPNVLALHLKRFKYIDSMYKKLSFRVVFPLELRLLNTSDDAEDADRLYELLAVVIHIGGGPNQGHYVAVAKSHDKWLIFDDDAVELIDEKSLQSYFGNTIEMAPSSLESGYILFYQAKDMSLKFDSKSSGTSTPRSDTSSESSKE